jgi:hypothetical protein
VAKAKTTAEEFRRLFETLGPYGVAEATGSTPTAVFSRRRNIEKAEGVPIRSPKEISEGLASGYGKRIELSVVDGVVLIGSDCHYFPDRATTAHRGFVKLARELAPKIVVLNGDVTNGTRNGRHPEIMWEGERPNVRQEFEAVDERLEEVKKAAPASERVWCLGNHDARFESKLSAMVPEYRGVAGFRLADHFPDWRICWSLWLNSKVVVKHRFKGGVHATYQNTLHAGMTMVTGHLHSLKVTPFSDYNGTRYGIDTGTLEEPDGPHANYTEGNPLNHRSGFVVLTFQGGQLLWPEIAAVIEPGKIQFRGKTIEV